MARPRVLLGMSGGVDSSVAALLLTEQGYGVEGITLQVWEHEDETTATSKKWQERGCCKVGIARHVAKLLNIPHRVVDTREKFQTSVVDDFVSGYLSGTTPNPCVRCNERVKFGMLYELAKSSGVEYVATGHYAQIRRTPNAYGLYQSVDAKKDQTYFLYRISRSWLSRILFPVGGLEKTDVWKRAGDLDLPVDELKESQEICFVTQGDYREFLKIEAPTAQRPGPFVDTTGGQIGEHRGIAFYTPGQRRGLGVATGERMYVKEVIPETNEVVLGSSDDLLQTTCCVSDLNWLEDSVHDGQTVSVKYRYGSPPVTAVLHRESENELTIEFAQPQHAISPGQSAVFYREDQVLGGGIIQRAKVPNKTEIPLHQLNVQNPSDVKSSGSTTVLQPTG
ncbi:MAG: tRNA 2-thiouridine(34) synthase MnmA [Nitrospirota bacterium]|nr:tRNA 2-thiouridine(34) synthase MnmA [Nitrospirota bacterium]